MKTTNYLIALLLLITGACKKEKALEPSNTYVTPATTSSSQSAYWGCWTQVNYSAAYDITLTEKTEYGHGVELSDSCVVSPTDTHVNGGIFRNDTLIFNVNTSNERWFYIKNDTLNSSVYNPSWAKKYKHVKH